MKKLMKKFIRHQETSRHLEPCFIWRAENDEESALITSMYSRQPVRIRVLDIALNVSILVLLLACWLMSDSVLAGVEPEPVDSDSSYTSAYSALWLKSNDGTSAEGATTLASNVSMSVSGPILRAKVRQIFHNPSQFWSEGVYTFPLPEQAAVDRLRMIVGERIIEGQIHEKKEAKRIYQQAREAGKKTSLLSHHRTNVFTTSIANIAPGQEVVVEFEYQQVLDFKAHRYSLRFPMVSTPQYSPSKTPPRMLLDSGFVEPVNVIRKADEIPGNEVDISVDLRAGFPIETLVSTSHSVTSEKLSEEHYKVKLLGLAKESNRDFVLSWQLKPTEEPMVRVLREDVDGESYGLLMVMPPQTKMNNSLPRELVLVLDVSGSMEGDSIEQARLAMLKAIGQLGPDDYFNIISFNTQAWKLFPQSQIAEQSNLNLARLNVQNQKANGGTDMRPALRMALNGADNPERLRQVVFITDGAVSNEAELFSEIRSNLGHSRLFTVGIGSAPNSYFMRKAARAGRGTFTYVSKPEEVDQKINALLSQLASPALTDIGLNLHGYSAEILPNPLPDLYMGEPVYVTFKASDFPDDAVLSGKLGGVPSRLSVSLQSSVNHEGVAVEWARQKISSLLEQHRDANKMERKQRVRNRIVEHAVAHHQVSKFTSLVAVDITPVRAGGLLNSTRIPANRPKGWLGRSAAGKKGIRLANTATDAKYRLLMGFELLVVAILIWLGRRWGLRFLQHRRV